MSTGVKTHRITDPNDDTRFVDVDPYVIEGIARARFGYNQDSSLDRQQMNVSSITVDSTGISTVNFTNAFTNTLYNPVLTGERASITGAPIVNWNIGSSSSSDIEVTVSDQTNTFQNGEFAGAIFGFLF